MLSVFGPHWTDFTNTFKWLPQRGAVCIHLWHRRCYEPTSEDVSCHVLHALSQGEIMAKNKILFNKEEHLPSSFLQKFISLFLQPQDARLKANRPELNRWILHKNPCLNTECDAAPPDRSDLSFGKWWNLKTFAQFPDNTRERGKPMKATTIGNDKKTNKFKFLKLFLIF